MNFNAKMDELFSSLSITPPYSTAGLDYLTADYVEVVGLFSNENFVSISDIQDRLIDIGERSVEEQDFVSSGIDGTTQGEELDEIHSDIIAIFSILKERVILFGNDYPFECDNGKIKLKETLNYRHKLYLMLLIASNLSLFKKVQGELTSEFETISYYAFKNYLPPKAIVKQFGNNSEYSGNAKTKIKSLAQDLRMNTNEYEINEIPERNSKERGLDIIGWLPFEEGCPNMLIILGQCACGRNWKGKHHDTRRFENYLQFYRSLPYHVLFIPYSLINYSQNKFYESAEIEKYTVIFDRKRLIEFYDKEDVFVQLDSYTLIDRCIDFEEDIV
jgi:hypothetical protein